MAITQIVFTDDIICPARQSSASDYVMARLCHELLGDALEGLLTGTTVALADELVDGSGFRANYYGATGMKPDMAAWSRTAAREPAPRQIALVQDLFADSLVVGVCLSTGFKKALQKAAIKWLDIIPHPARFIRGPALGIAGNIPRLDLKAWLLTDARAKSLAAAAKARISFPPRRRLTSDKAGSALFVCQPACAREMWKNGAPVDVEDFQEEIFGLARKHDKILVMRDGYAEPEKSDLFLTQLCPKTRLYEGGFYEALKQQEIAAVYSLTSDIPLIAPWFGKTGKILAPPSCRFGTRAEPGSCLPVLNPLPDGAFWAEILRRIGLTVQPAQWRQVEDAWPAFFDPHGEEAAIF